MVSINQIEEINNEIIVDNYIKTAIPTNIPFNYENALSDMDIGQTFRKSRNIYAGNLSKQGYCFPPDQKTEFIYETLRNNPEITEFTVIEDNTAIGFLTRTELNEMLGGRFGFSLHAKQPIQNIMKKDFLIVDYYMSIEQVSKISMKRSSEQLYNPIVVELEGNYYGILTVKDLLDACRRIALAERDEIALMRDSLKIGMFFIDRNLIIQDQYSKYLEDLFSETNLCAKYFTDILKSSVTTKELTTIQDYFSMIFDDTLDQDMIDDINPLMELKYIGKDQCSRKVLQFDFATIKKKNKEIFVLVSVYDNTAEFDLRQKLAEEESKMQEEMKSVFELLQADPHVFQDFVDDMDHEFKQINNTLKNREISEQIRLVDIYQSVHAIKSNAFTLGQNTFGNKVHNIESKIKKMRDQDEIISSNILDLANDIEMLVQEKNKLTAILERINSYKIHKSVKSENQLQYVLIETLSKTVNKVSEDMGKKVKFVIDKIDDEAIKKGQRRIIKEVLVQLIRNSVVHGIETIDERISMGKKKTGIIRLSIKLKDDGIHIKLEDNGRGIDYEKIANKAIKQNLIKQEDKNNKKKLLSIIFSPGFSTAKDENIHGGRGIGLNLVYSRIKENKGYIKVHTEYGKGTAFHLFLPV
jgi:two-component system chemotaxis sensor kinase CheA